MKELIIDCFAGGGGASVGIEMALGRPVDIAINHDPGAILMHKTNHPTTLHLTEDIFKVNLRKYVKNQHVALMWASPDCTSHSKAKGGKPRERGLRILPWAVYKHAKEILPDVILMENVEEIQQWGPLDEKGYPIPERKGEELKLAQGFPKDYIIDKDYNWKPYPKSKQVARIGNSVVPIMAQKLVEANCPYLKVGVRVPNLNIDDSQEQLRFA